MIKPAGAQDLQLQPHMLLALTSAENPSTFECLFRLWELSEISELAAHKSYP